MELSLNERQKEFFAAQEKYVLYGGAKGGGKSWSIRWRSIFRRLKYPGSKGLILRRTYPELQRTHIEKIATEIPKSWGLRYNAQKKQLIFPNGSVQEFGSVQYEHNVSNYQGAEYDDIGIDEATQFTEKQFSHLKTNIRTTRTDLKTQIYLGANPGGVGHGWVKRMFVKPEHSDPQFRFIPAKVYDNPVLMQADPDYIKELEKLPEALKRAFLDGDWDIFEGQAFSEWRDEIHVLRGDMPISLDACHKLICFDWGYNDPGVALWLAFTPENRFGVSRCYVYRELHQNRKSPDEWAADIKQFTDIEKVDFMVLPHDCFDSNRGNDSIAKTFQTKIKINIVRGNTLVAGARKNRKATTHRYLSIAPDGLPYLQILPSCINLIRTLPELVYSQFSPEDIDTDGDDHDYDALSLGLISRRGSVKNSGAIQPVRLTDNLGSTPAWGTNAQGQIVTPDFWKELKDKALVSSGKDWEHR